MENMLSIIDGSGRDFGQGGLVAIFSIILVFCLLALIILITWIANKIIVKFETKPKKEVTEENTAEKSVQINDEDAMVAVLVASIDYRNQTKKNIKVINVKEIK